LWIIFMEIVSSSMGGYLAGRLRTRWTVIHGDEVYFRDTAHGFLSWSTAFVVTAALLGSAATAMIGDSSSRSVTEGATAKGANAYFVDALLRTNTPKAEYETSAQQSEVATIFATSLKHGELAANDKAYLGSLVSARTGLNQTDADRRVSDTYTALQQSTELARKSTAHTLLWIFIALLIGAFCASFAGTIGGKQRDNVVIL
jgi:hypothetical protein